MHLGLDVVAHAYNTSSWEAETVSSKLVYATELICKQKHNKTPK